MFQMKLGAVLSKPLSLWRASELQESAPSSSSPPPSPERRAPRTVDVLDLKDQLVGPAQSGNSIKMFETLSLDHERLNQTKDVEESRNVTLRAQTTTLQRLLEERDRSNTPQSRKLVQEYVQEIKRERSRVEGQNLPSLPSFEHSASDLQWTADATAKRDSRAKIRTEIKMAKTSTKAAKMPVHKKVATKTASSTKRKAAKAVSPHSSEMMVDTADVSRTAGPSRGTKRAGDVLTETASKKKTKTPDIIILSDSD